VQEVVGVGVLLEMQEVVVVVEHLMEKSEKEEIMIINLVVTV
jgi:hypothetical protein